MKRLLSLSGALALVVWLWTASTEAQRRDGPPRRLTDPEDISLPGKSRVEFKSFHSASLGKEMAYSVFLPPSYDSSERDFPVAYFLHGMFNDHTSWCVDRYGNLPPQIEQMMLQRKIPEFLIVHPSGEQGFYTDSADGLLKYEQYLASDTIAEIESRYRVKPGRQNRTIGGTSMGGYGALKLAFKRPELFSAVLAGSPIILLGDDPLAGLTANPSRATEFFSQIFARVYGDPFDKEHWKKNSLMHLAEDARFDGLRIKMLYGTADRYNGMIPMEQGVKALDEKLRQRGANVSLEVFEGQGHGWSLIVDHLEESVKFLSEGF